MDTEEICTVHFCTEIHRALTLLWSIRFQVEGTPEVINLHKNICMDLSYFWQNIVLFRHNQYSAWICFFIVLDTSLWLLQHLILRCSFKSKRTKKNVSTEFFSVREVLVDTRSLEPMYLVKENIFDAVMGRRALRQE